MKQTTQAFRVAALFLSATLAACGGGIGGDWQSNCVNNGDGTSTRRTFDFDGSNVTQVVRTYSGTACSGTATATTTYNGTFTESDSTANDDWTNIDITYTSPSSSQVFDVYQISDGRLYFGDINTGDKTTTGTRPTALSTALYFERD